MKEHLDYNRSVTVQEFAEQVCDLTPKEKCIYKAELKVEDYPSDTIRTHKLTSGDEFYIGDKNNIVKPGDKFKSYPAVITEVYYEPKKWWQFWKRKKQIGYRVRWFGD